MLKKDFRVIIKQNMKEGYEMIIDTHVHIGKILNYNMTEEQVIYSMEKYGISYSLVSNIECSENDHKMNPISPELLKPQNLILYNTLRFARAYSDKIGVLAWLKIRTEQPDHRFKKLIDENRDIIYGLKLHPYHSQTAPDDDKLEPYYRIAAEYGLPIVSHTGGCEAAASQRLYNAAKKHPELAFIMVHMDLGTDNKTALELLGKLPNLYGDTTWVPITTTLEAVRRYGSEKMIFGSDNPIDGKDTYLHNKIGERSLYQQYFNEFKSMIPQEDYENIMYKNALRIFGIKLPTSL